MRDRDESTAAPTFEDDAGWRESVLHELRPGARDTLRALSVLVVELARESGLLAARPEGAVKSALRAAAGDLRYLQGFLDSIGAYRTTATLEPEEWRLADQAARLAPQVGATAGELEAVIG